MFGWFREHVYKMLARSPRWPGVRRAYIARNPNCAVCGKSVSQVHHVEPFHLDPKLELDPTNLIGFCGTEHHILFGHLENWKSYNPDVRKDAAQWVMKIKNRPDGGDGKGQ